MGRIANRNSYLLEGYCGKHCPTEDCPHKEATTVDIPIPIPCIYPSSAFYGTLDYRKVSDNVGPKEKVNILEQGNFASQREGRETPVPGPSGSASMGSGIPEQTAGSPEGVSAPRVTRRT